MLVEGKKYDSIEDHKNLERNIYTLYKGDGCACNLAIWPTYIESFRKQFKFSIQE